MPLLRKKRTILIFSHFLNRTYSHLFAHALTKQQTQQGAITQRLSYKSIAQRSALSNSFAIRLATVLYEIVPLC